MKRPVLPVRNGYVPVERLDNLLQDMESYRRDLGPDADSAVRLCQGLVATAAGYPDRASWHHLLSKSGAIRGVIRDGAIRGNAHIGSGEIREEKVTT